jgi:hypothetical protein
MIVPVTPMTTDTAMVIALAEDLQIAQYRVKLEGFDISRRA